MKLIVEAEVFVPGSRVWRLAAMMRWRFQHALGVACSLWHSSQAAELSEATSAEILTFCGPLSKTERVRLLDSMEACGLITRVADHGGEGFATRGRGLRDEGASVSAQGGEGFASTSAQGGDDGARASRHVSEVFRINGNEHHIKAKKINSIAQRNRALERWKKIEQNDAGGMENGSRRHAGADARSEQSGSVQSGAERIIPQTPALAPEGMAEEAHTEIEARPNIPPPSDPLPPLTNNLAEITTSQIPATAALKLFEVYQDAREKHCHIQRVLIPGGLDLTHCKTLIAMSGGDEKAAAAIVRAFTKNAGPKKFWSERKWSLWILAEPRNYELARALAAEMKQKAPTIDASA